MLPQTLQPGDAIPTFTAHDHEGTPMTNADLRGSKWAIFFYPKNNTPGCTAEACNLRDNVEALEKQGFKLLGISPDSVRSHEKFRDKHRLPFPLLSDPDHEVARAFGVWGPKKFMGREYDGIHRTTFLIDEHGTITDVIGKVKTKAHAEQILAVQ